ncbi:hypothetical protein [Allorhizobium taibaishanense]|uniref:Uncharacterized protein n=1 Tax=Allorhizobium taibaishanense TaxID=887144 RepID=A0A7W6MTP3_9HYPH|nr:hypothetical protein [Allorhizobium taibaishanense]MBB4007427.1 hypothetical protein [Allorhizobium taibaishanense]
MFQQMMQVLVFMACFMARPTASVNGFFGLGDPCCIFLIGSENILPMSRLRRI